MKNILQIRSDVSNSEIQVQGGLPGFNERAVMSRANSVSQRSVFAN